MVPEKLFNGGMLILIWSFGSENQFCAGKHGLFEGDFMGTMCFFALAITHLIGPHVTGRLS